MTDVMAAVEAIRDHADDYQLAHDYYRGEVGELFASEGVRRALGEQVAGFDINLAARPVDAVLDRVRILAIAVPDDEPATRALIDQVWVPNRMDRRSKQIHRGALVHGDAYLTVWDGEADGSVEMHYNSPVTTRVFYEDENPQVKKYAAKLWHEGDSGTGVYRLNLYYRDRIEKWVTAPGGKGDDTDEWLEYVVDGEAWPIPNPYNEVPVFHFRTDETYGRPAHRGAYGPQNAITKLSATLMNTVDHHGFPLRYALQKAGQVSASQVFDDDENPEATADRITAGPGTIVTLPGVDSVGQFPAAEVRAFLEPLGFYVRAMAASTATPLRFFDPQGQIPSGEALRGDEAPLAQRIVDFEEMAEEEWQAVLAFAARVAGLVPAIVDVKWAPVQTVEDLQGWQTVKAKQEAGVPAHQALTEAGYTSEVVETWLAGADVPNLDTRVRLLGEIGTALQRLGAASQLGVVDQTAVQRVVDALIAGLETDAGDAA